MKQLIFSILLFFTYSCYGQKTIDTLKGYFDNTSSWYKEIKKWDDTMGLSDLLFNEDSLCVRFRDGMNIVDIIVNKQGLIKANCYCYIFKLNNKNKVEKIIYNKSPIDRKTAKSFLDTLYKLDIPKFYSDEKIPKYPITVDGIVYNFIFSTATTYKNISFANPSESLEINEGKTVYKFVKYATQLLDLDKNFSNLKLILTKGRYRVSNTLIYTIK